MAQLDLNKADTTELNTTDIQYSIPSESIDDAQTKNVRWTNPNWSKYLGKYLNVAVLKQAIDAVPLWAVGRGWETDVFTSNVLDFMTGWGEDSFTSIMRNLLIVKKVNGDAYAEIIRDAKGRPINLKPLNPASVAIVVSEKGIITGFEELDLKTKTKIRTFTPREIFHICNNRIANQIHGTSIIESCEWIIDALNEAMEDKRRIMHRKTIRVIEVDVDDTTTNDKLKAEYKEAIKNGEVLLIPKGNAGFPQVPDLPTAEHSDWIRYLEGLLYKALGVPEVILGGAQQYTEANSKVGYMTWEQPYVSEQMELEADLWLQLGFDIYFDKPVSMRSPMQESEAANTGQTGIQPNETSVSMTRTE